MKKMKHSIDGTLSSPLFYGRDFDFYIYVEDYDPIGVNEKFYEILLQRIFVGKKLMIKGLGGKSEVLKTHKAYIKNPEGHSVFIIDGDFKILNNNPTTSGKGLYQLKKYCIENYLIDENAIISVIYFSDKKNRKDRIKQEFDFHGWFESNNKAAISLYTIYAVCDVRRIDRTKTSKRPLKEYHPDDLGILHHGAVETLIKLTERSLISKYSNKEIHIIMKGVKECITKNNYTMLDICSGKSMLIPLLHKRSISKFDHECKDTDIFRNQLASQCDISGLSDLPNYIY